MTDFPARFPGWCPVCELRINVGDSIRYAYQGHAKSLCHTNCDQPARTS